MVTKKAITKWGLPVYQSYFKWMNKLTKQFQVDIKEQGKKTETCSSPYRIPLLSLPETNQSVDVRPVGRQDQEINFTGNIKLFYWSWLHLGYNNIILNILLCNTFVSFLYSSAGLPSPWAMAHCQAVACSELGRGSDGQACSITCTRIGWASMSSSICASGRCACLLLS